MAQGSFDDECRRRPGCPCGGSLRGLLAEAREARRVRFGTRSEDGSGRGRARTGQLLERLLSGGLPAIVDCGRLLDRVATLHQMTATSIGTLMTSSIDFQASRVRARALGVAVDAILHFVDAGAARHGLATIYFCTSRSEGSLIIAIAAQGAFQPVAPAAASAGLLRAIRIVEAEGGEFQRGLDDRRMAFGITFGGQ